MNEAVALTTDWRPVKLRVADYLMLDAAGALDRYGRTELIEGEIVYMNAQHRPHARVKSRLHVLLAAALVGRNDELEALVEGSVEMLPDSAPESDIVITREPLGEGLIPLASLVIVIEVADTTLRNDLTRKARLYAQAGLPEYWVLDVEGRRLHQMWSPAAQGYGEARQVAFGSVVVSATIAELAVNTDGL